jgi:hypothetical protein
MDFLVPVRRNILAAVPVNHFPYPSRTKAD